MPKAHPTLGPAVEIAKQCLGTPAMHFLELKIPPVAVGAILAFSMWLTAFAAPTFALVFPGRWLCAAGLTLLGTGISASGVVSFRRARTTLNPTKPGTAASLVVSGIYRFTRNPMYLGFSVVLLGWAVFLSNPLALVGAAAFVVYITRFQIVPEERALAALFGLDFLDYKRRVRRWV